MPPPHVTPLFFSSALAFRDWLARHAATEDELIVGFHKVATGRPCMTWSESVDEALCVGWIDGVRKRVDDDAYQIRFTPRKPTSIWSAVNIAKVQALQAQGRMTPAGERAYGLRTASKSVVYSSRAMTHMRAPLLIIAVRTSGRFASIRLTRYAASLSA